MRCLPYGIALTITLALGASASGGLRAQSLAPLTQNPSVASSLTPEFISRMLTLMSLRGSDHEIPAPFANALGLTPAGESWLNRQVAAKGQATEFLHGFAVSRGSDTDLVLSVRNPDALLVFRAHREGALLGALRFDFKTKQITPLDPKLARTAFADECAFWKSSVDALIKYEHNPHY